MSYFLEVPTVAMLLYLVYELRIVNARVAKIENMLNIPVDILLKDVQNGEVKASSREEWRKGELGKPKTDSLTL